MRVSTLVTVAVVIGFQLAGACPPGKELEMEAARCLGEMMQFLNAPEKERESKCPNLKAGTDCVDKILEACKDNLALRDQYDMMKKRLSTSRDDYQKFCGGSSSVVSSVFLMLVACVACVWFHSSL